MMPIILAMLLASDAGVEFSQHTELGCAAARRIVLGARWRKLTKGQELPAVRAS